MLPFGNLGHGKEQTTCDFVNVLRVT